MAGPQIDDRQAAMPQCDTRPRIPPLVVGSAMHERSQHPPERFGLLGPAADDSG